jgi:subtilase family serine protease
MSWGGSESSSETTDDSKYFSHAGTLYTASAGDSAHGAFYPAASPEIVSVGGTTLNGCSGTSCAGFSSETTWSDGSGGVSRDEAIPAYQTAYTGPVYGAATIAALTGSKRGIPDVSFVGNPSTGVSVYDSYAYEGESGWWTLGGTSVGAPNWAGILAAGQAAGSTALQGDAAIYSGGYQSSLRDITSGTNGSCGTDCTAGTGYDLVTGLGSPINYP